MQIEPKGESMSKFGQAAGSVEDLKKSLASSGGGTWIKGVPQEGLTVRFLQEPNEWFVYKEHWHGEKQRFFPCVGDNCPGCAITDEDGRVRRSQRYLTNALLVDDNDNVVPLKLPKSLAESIIVRFERYKTVIDRDYELIRQGKGLNTTYDVMTDEPMDRNLAKYEVHDLEQALQDAWDEVWGETAFAAAATAPDDVGKTRATKTTHRKGSLRNPTEEEVREAGGRFGEDDESVADDAWTEEELKGMAIGQLRALASDYDVPHDRETKKAMLIELVMEAQDG